MKNKKSTLFILSLSLVSTLTSCTLFDEVLVDEDDPINQVDDSNVKEAYNNLSTKVDDLYYYDEANEGYWIIDNNTFTFIGDFNLNNFSFDDTNYYFDLVSGELDKDASFLNADKVIINKTSNTIYSKLIYENDLSYVSELSNSNNYDKLFYYSENNAGEYVINLKFISYEFYSDYKDKLMTNYQNLYGNDLYSLYRHLDFKSTFNNHEVKEISNISNQYKTYVSDTNLNISITIEEGISIINEGSFKDFIINSELILPESLTYIGESAFENTTIYRLIISDNPLNFMTNSFKDSLILNLGFKSYLTNNFNTFPYNDLVNYIEPYITFGVNLRKYDSISEGFNKENVINPLAQVELNDNDVISDDNLEIINENQTLFLAHNLVDLNNNLLYKDTIREYNPLSLTNEDIENYKNTITLKLTNDLTIYGDVYIGGVVSTSSHPNQGFISGDYASIDLNGHKITIENGGLLDSNGLIYDSLGSGGIEVKEGGTLITNFVINDYYGGTNTANKYFSNETPFMLYKLPYLKTDITIRYGANLNAHCVLYALSTFNSTTQTVIGKDGLFEIKDNKSNIVLETLDEENNFKNYLKIYGNVKTNVMSLNLGFITVSTERVYFPIPKYFDIDVYNGSFEITNKIKLLPGSNINLYNDATLILSNELFIASELPKKEDLVGIAQYPDYYGDLEIEGAKVNFYDNSTLLINKDVNTGLGGELNFTNKDIYEEVKLSIISNTKFTSPLTSTEGYGYHKDGDSYVYHLIKSYTKEASASYLIDDNKIETTFKNGSFSYILNHSSNELSALNTNNEVIANYINNSWTIKVNDTDVTIDLYENRLLNQVIDNEGNMYSYLNGYFSKLDYDEETKLYYDGSNYFIEVNDEAIQGNLNERNLFKTSDDKYYFYVDSTLGWLEVTLYENGNIIVRMDNPNSPTSTMLNHCYFYDKTTNSYIETDHLSNGTNVTNSNYTRHTFKYNSKYYFFDINSNMIEIGGTSNYPSNVKYDISGTDGKKYVYMNELEGFISEDNFTLDEESLIYTVTINGETNKYVPIAVGELGLVKGEEVTSLNGMTLFKFSKENTDGAHVSNFAIRGDSDNRWFMASVINNEIVYYTQPNASSTYTYQARVYLTGDKYNLYTKTNYSDFVTDGDNINIYNLNDSGTYTVCKKNSETITIEELGITINTHSVIEENVIIYNNQKTTLVSKNNGLYTGSDGNQYAFVNKSISVSGSYRALKGYVLVKKSSQYDGFYNCTYVSGDNTYELIGGFIDTSAYVANGCFDILNENNGTLSYDADKNCYKLGSYSYYVYVNGRLFSITIVATNSGTSKIYNSSSDYYNYTLVRDPNTKEWSLVAPNA